jgi:hypothetical protein
MSNRVAIVGILALTALAFATDSALAASRLPINEARASCKNSGGAFFGPNKSGVYGCRSHGFVCGGTTPSDKNSCDYF